MMSKLCYPLVSLAEEWLSPSLKPFPKLLVVKSFEAIIKFRLHGVPKTQVKKMGRRESKCKLYKKKSTDHPSSE